MTYHGEEILVGSRTLLLAHASRESYQSTATAREECQKYTSREAGRCLEPSELLTFCVQRQRMRLPPCDKWV